MNWKKIFIIIILSISLVVVSTIQHIGVSPDSTIYISAAKSFSNGFGLIMPVIGTPLTHFPPLFPIILSIAPSYGIPLLQWAYALNLATLVANLLLAGLLTYQLNQKMNYMFIALIAFSPAFQIIHMFVWSEPLFILFVFMAIYLSGNYLLNKNKFLWFAAIFAGLAWMDRYIGIAVITAIFGGIWLFSTKKITDSLQILVISISPMFFWVITNKLNLANATNRTIQLHPIELNEALIIISLLLGSMIIYKFVKSNIIQTLLILFVFSYTAVLAITICLFDADTPVIDDRMLSPIIFAAFLLASSIKFKPRLQRIYSYATFFMVAIFFLASAYISYQESIFGLFFSDGSWYNIPPHAW